MYTALNITIGQLHIIYAEILLICMADVSGWAMSKWILEK
jgi:hypothetical protein